MHIICLTPLEEGVYNDHKADHITTPPEGWAYIPEDIILPSTFPRLGSLEAEELTYIREVEVEREVIKPREIESFDEEGKSIIITEEYTEMEMVMETQEYKMMTVTAMTEGTLPEPEEPSIQDQIASLKAELEATDYKIIKCSEAQLVGEELPYDIVSLHTERQAIRNEINELEKQLEGGNE